jgi:hypothetical protein
LRGQRLGIELVEQAAQGGEIAWRATRQVGQRFLRQLEAAVARAVRWLPSAARYSSWAAYSSGL